jgi:uncharacterized membrane protein
MTKKRPHPEVHTVHKKRGFVGAFRASFLTGLVVVLPIGLTFWLIWNVVGWIDSWVLPFIPNAWHPDTLFAHYVGYEPPVTIRGAGVAIFLVFTIMVGWIAKGLIGRSLIIWGESLVDRMPFVRSIYNGLKQIAETVFAQGETKFDRACLIEYPRKGLWAVGFVSIAAKGEIADLIPSEDEILTVFIPTTPNPTSGFLLYVPAKDVRILQRMGVEDAAKLIISAGLVYPNGKDTALPAAGAK